VNLDRGHGNGGVAVVVRPQSLQRTTSSTSRRRRAIVSTASSRTLCSWSRASRRVLPQCAHASTVQCSSTSERCVGRGLRPAPFARGFRVEERFGRTDASGSASASPTLGAVPGDDAVSPSGSAGAGSLVSGGRAPVTFRRSLVRSSLISWLCFAAIWSSSSNCARSAFSSARSRAFSSSRGEDMPAFPPLPQTLSRGPGRSDRSNYSILMSDLADIASAAARATNRPPPG
jgi:hypothetical protein